MSTKIRTQQWETIYDRNGTARKAPTRRLDMERMNARPKQAPRMTRGRFRVVEVVWEAVVVVVTAGRKRLSVGLQWAADWIGGRGDR